MFRRPLLRWVAGELRVIQQIERLDANLELALTPDVEAAEDARVDVCDSRAAEFVTMRVPEVGLGSTARLNWFSEGSRVKPRLATADRVVAWRAVVAAELVVGCDEIGVLRV